MVKIPFDSRFDFHHSIGTEDRFSLRSWFEKLIAAINYNDAGEYEPRLSESIIVEGFTPEPMNYETYKLFLKDRVSAQPIRTLRFPDLKVSFKHYLYRMEGTYEEFIDGILSYEGTVELAVLKHDEAGYQLVSLKFYPRLMPRHVINEDQAPNI